MRLLLLPYLIAVAAGTAADLYIFNVLRHRCRSIWPARVHLVTAVLLLAMAVTAVCLPVRSGNEDVLRAVMWMLYAYLAFYLPKLLFVIIDMAARIPCLWGHRRSNWLSLAGASVSVLLCVVLWWAALVNRYRIDVREVTVEIDNLPEQFDGYRIAQFSDAHVGTYGNDTVFVSRIVETINGLSPDAVMFTGDIVNMRTAELEPHACVLGRIHAPDGVFAIFGNHDYGDYSEWESPGDKAANRSRLIELNRIMGWTLLLDSHRWITRGGDSIAVTGVENIGDFPFPSYGSLERAQADRRDNKTTILLSHNPAHWSDSICGTDKDIALTLSGHTHAMQCEIFGWSPARFRYERWGGLYRSPRGQQLYVNIGTGTVGFPARIGATPEITLLTLKRKSTTLK